jgi:hypothetical protein
VLHLQFHHLAQYLHTRSVSFNIYLSKLFPLVA